MDSIHDCWFIAMSESKSHKSDSFTNSKPFYSDLLMQWSLIYEIFMQTCLASKDTLLKYWEGCNSMELDLQVQSLDSQHFILFGLTWNLKLQGPQAVLWVCKLASLYCSVYSMTFQLGLLYVYLYSIPCLSKLVVFLQNFLSYSNFSLQQSTVLFPNRLLPYNDFSLTHLPVPGYTVYTNKQLHMQQGNQCKYQWLQRKFIYIQFFVHRSAPL